MTALVRDVRELDRLDPLRARVRDILVHVQPEAAAGPRLQAAVYLARELEARLFGLAAEMMPPVATSDPYGLLAGEFVGPLQEIITENLAEAEKVFRRAADGVETQWGAVQDEPVRVLARAARAADLIVAGGSPLDYRDGTRWCDPAQLALTSGRPVLVVPPDGGELRLDAVVVAWKDTREARRAVGDALPFLLSADEVQVLELCRSDGLGEAEFRTASVVDGLKRHGVNARPVAKIAALDAVGAELNLAAQQMGADLLVAGCYGHSRLGEWAFGGATRDLLQQPQRFVLLSH